MIADLEKNIVAEGKEMQSLNHSFICAEIAEQLFENKKIKALPELTLDIENGITPDLSIYPREEIQPNFRRDITRFPKMPILAIEVISTSQNIQDLLIKADTMIENGIKTVWTIEPFTQTIFVTTKQGEEKLTNQTVESDGLKVDFQKIFG